MPTPTWLQSVQASTDASVWTDEGGGVFSTELDVTLPGVVLGDTIVLALGLSTLDASFETNGLYAQVSSSGGEIYYSPTTLTGRYTTAGAVNTWMELASAFMDPSFTNAGDDAIVIKFFCSGTPTSPLVFSVVATEYSHLMDTFDFDFAIGIRDSVIGSNQSSSLTITDGLGGGTGAFFYVALGMAVNETAAVTANSGFTTEKSASGLPATSSVVYADMYEVGGSAASTTLSATGVSGDYALNGIIGCFFIVPACAFNTSETFFNTGDTVTLTWTTNEYTTAVSIDQGIGSVATSGSVNVNPIGTVTYTLTATGVGGDTTQCQVFLYLNLDSTFSASENPFHIGDAVTLSWTTNSNATGASIDQGIGTVALNGSVVVYPTEETIYTLTVTGPGDSSQPRELDLMVDLTPGCTLAITTIGGTGLTQWQAEDYYNPGNPFLASVIIDSSGRYQWASSATTGQSGTTTPVFNDFGGASVTDAGVTWDCIQASDDGGITSHTNAIIAFGSSITLTWTSTGADSATISYGATTVPVPVSGSGIFSPGLDQFGTGTITFQSGVEVAFQLENAPCYTLTVTNENGSNTCTVQFALVLPTLAATIDSFAPVNVATGDTACGFGVAYLPATPAGFSLWQPLTVYPQAYPVIDSNGAIQLSLDKLGSAGTAPKWLGVGGITTEVTGKKWQCLGFAYGGTYVQSGGGPVWNNPYSQLGYGWEGMVIPQFVSAGVVYAPNFGYEEGDIVFFPPPNDSYTGAPVLQCARTGSSGTMTPRTDFNPPEVLFNGQVINDVGLGNTGGDAVWVVLGTLYVTLNWIGTYLPAPDGYPMETDLYSSGAGLIHDMGITQNLTNVVLSSGIDSDNSLYPDIISFLADPASQDFYFESFQTATIPTCEEPPSCPKWHCTGLGSGFSNSCDDGGTCNTSYTANILGAWTEFRVPVSIDIPLIVDVTNPWGPSGVGGGGSGSRPVTTPVPPIIQPTPPTNPAAGGPGERTATPFPSPSSSFPSFPIISPPCIENDCGALVVFWAYGASGDYTRYTSSVQINDQLNVPTLATIVLQNSDTGFVLPPQGSYVWVWSQAYCQYYFTGFVTSPPQLAALGLNPRAPGAKQYSYTMLCTSDEYLLNNKTVPFIPPYVGLTQGQILAQLASTLAPGFLDVTSFVASGDIVPYFQYNPANSWASVAQQFGNQTHYHYKVVNRTLYYQPYGDEFLGVRYDETRGEPYFNPYNLTVNSQSIPVINDAIVLGITEGGNYCIDYFMGDGFTGSFNMTEQGFRTASNLFLNETWQSIDPNLYTTMPNQNGLPYFQAFQGALNCIGGQGIGTSYIQYANAIELSGVWYFQHGSVVFTSQSSGIVGGLYSQYPFVLENCIAGFYCVPLSGSNLKMEVFPIINGEVMDDVVPIQVDDAYLDSYLLSTQVSCSQQFRYTRKFPTKQGPVFGGQEFDASATISFYCSDANPNYPLTPTVTTWQYTIDVPMVALYVPFNSGVSPGMNASVTLTQIYQPPQAALYETPFFGQPPEMARITDLVQSQFTVDAVTHNKGSLEHTFAVRYEPYYYYVWESVAATAWQYMTILQPSYLLSLPNQAQQVGMPQVSDVSIIYPPYMLTPIPGQSIEVSVPSINGVTFDLTQEMNWLLAQQTTNAYPTNAIAYGFGGPTDKAVPPSVVGAPASAMQFNRGNLNYNAGISESSLTPVQPATTLPQINISFVSLSVSGDYIDVVSNLTTAAVRFDVYSGDNTNTFYYQGAATPLTPFLITDPGSIVVFAVPLSTIPPTIGDAVTNPGATYTSVADSNTTPVGTALRDYTVTFYSGSITGAYVVLEGPLPIGVDTAGALYSMTNIPGVLPAFTEVTYTDPTTSNQYVIYNSSMGIPLLSGLVASYVVPPGDPLFVSANDVVQGVYAAQNRSYTYDNCLFIMSALTNPANLSPYQPTTGQSTSNIDQATLCAQELALLIGRTDINVTALGVTGNPLSHAYDLYNGVADFGAALYDGITPVINNFDNAWAVYALSYYSVTTGDTSVVSNLMSLLQFLASEQWLGADLRQNLITRGYKKVFSFPTSSYVRYTDTPTNTNIIAFMAFSWAAYALSNPTLQYTNSFDGSAQSQSCQQLADSIETALLTLWAQTSSTTGHFVYGIENDGLTIDPSISLDAQTLGAQFMIATGNFTEAGQALDFIFNYNYAGGGLYLKEFTMNLSTNPLNYNEAFEQLTPFDGVTNYTVDVLSSAAGSGAMFPSPPFSCWQEGVWQTIAALSNMFQAVQYPYNSVVVPLGQLVAGQRTQQTLGFGQQNQTASITSGNNYSDVLEFYNNTIPLAQTLVELRYRKAQIARAHISDSANQALWQNIYPADDGVRGAVISNLNPSPRNSAECEAAAQAAITDAENPQYQGSYQVVNFCGLPFFYEGPEFPITGRYLFVNAPQWNLTDETKLIVQQNSTSIIELRKEVVQWEISYGQDTYLSKTIGAFLLPTQTLIPTDTAQNPPAQELAFVGNYYIQDLDSVLLTNLSSTGVTFDVGVAPATGFAVEVRLSDLGWGTSEADNFVGDFITQQFTLARTELSQTYYMRLVGTTSFGTVVVQPTSNGLIWQQIPATDGVNLLLTASDVGLTADVYIFNSPPDQIIPLDSVAPGNFTVAHSLGVTPVVQIIQMTSSGVIVTQYPTSADASNVYLTASDLGLTGAVYLWKTAPPLLSNFAAIPLTLGTAGNQSVPHGLGVAPQVIVITMSSLGLIWVQTPIEADATNIYLTASDAGLTGVAYVWG